jgi:hypothetical protein
MWVMLGLVCAIGWVVNTWIRAKHGYPLDNGTGGQVHRRGPAAADVTKQVQDALAERDALIAKLEARIRVLERIVTDEPMRLGAEIERLRSS